MKTKLSPFFLVSCVVCLLALISAPSAQGQVPQGFSYQAIVRDGITKQPILSQPVIVRVTIENAAHTSVYQETHSLSTDEFGIIALVVGNGTPTGAELFGDIYWNKEQLYIKTELKYPATNPTFTEMGTAPLQSVPYAIAADSLSKPLTKLSVTGETSDLQEALFEVKNKDKQTIFAVYNEGVRIYVDNGAKGPKGGFAVGGFGTGKDPSQEYLRVTGDSTRIYVNENAKGPKGGFAIGGFAAKEGEVRYMNITPLNYFIGHESGKGLKEGQFNTIFGYQAGKALTNGNSNIFIGQTAGLRDTLGGNNIFLGNNSGAYNANGNYNIFIGNQSGYRNEEGTHNTYIGYQSGYYGGYLTTDPSYNTYVGYQSGLNNRTGQYNTYIGHKAGRSGSSASGNRNVFVGDSAGLSNISGNDNVFIGKAAGQANTTGNSNVILGSKAGYLNNGDYNIFIGFESGMKNNATGDARYSNLNTFIGYKAGRENTKGWHNLAIGFQAGMTNSDATNQFFIGDNSGEKLVDGYGNTFVGHLTGAKVTDASNNTFIGYQVGYNNLTGDNNTILGYAAGIHVTGSGNILIGSRAGYDETRSNKLYIENSSVDSTEALVWGDFENNLLRFNANVGIGVNPKYKLDLGDNTGKKLAVYQNSAGTSLYGFGISTGTLEVYAGAGSADNPVMVINNAGRVGIGDTSPSYTLEVNGSAGKPGGGDWSNPSDIRLKDIHGDYLKGLEAVCRLNPVVFNYKKNNPRDLPSDEEYIGFVAQDIQEIFPEAVSRGDDGYLDFNMHAVNIALVNAIKEQQEQIRSQQAQIDELKTMIGRMEEKIASSPRP